MQKNALLKLGATAAAAMLHSGCAGGGDGDSADGTAVLYSANNENANQTEEDFAKLAENLVTNESSSVLFPAIAQGEYAVALGYKASIVPFIKGEQPGIEMVYPEDGTFASYEAVGV